ncbi:hypothetical protein QL285_051603 [Trifolium repens]|nr:hypothetical protein QL285_051603 [Trifolium repens]
MNQKPPRVKKTPIPPPTAAKHHHQPLPEPQTSQPLRHLQPPPSKNVYDTTITLSETKTRRRSIAEPPRQCSRIEPQSKRTTQRSSPPLRKNAGELNGGTRSIRSGHTTKNDGYILRLVDLDEREKKSGGSEIQRREKAEHVFCVGPLRYL